MSAHDQPVSGRRRPEWTRQNLELSYPEALSLRALARWKRRKAERQLAKSTFVPEPGHIHAGELAVVKARALEERLMAFVESYPEYDPHEWDHDDDG
jgi:hypothetical protein